MPASRQTLATFKQYLSEKCEAKLSKIQGKAIEMRWVCGQKCLWCVNCSRYACTTDFKMHNIVCDAAKE